MAPVLPSSLVRSQERQEEAFAMAIAELVARKLVSCDFLKAGVHQSVPRHHWNHWIPLEKQNDP